MFKRKTVADITAAFQVMVQDLHSLAGQKDTECEMLESRLKEAAAERDRAREIAGKIGALL